MLRIGFVVTLALAGATWWAAPQASTVVITGVNVVDVINGQVLSNRTVTTRGQTIERVDTAGAVDPGPRAIDGRGKFLIPGLWDMHAHIFEMWLALNVANGVTGIRDMGNDLDEILRMRAATAAGTLVGPRIFAAGPILDDPPAEWPLRQRVRNAEEGRAAVRQLKQRGVNLIKVHNFTPRDAFFAIADEARQQGLPIAGHVPLKVPSIDEAIEAGMTSIEHFSEDGRVWKWCSGGNVYRPAACQPFFKTLVEKRVWQTPTLVAITDRGQPGTPASRISADERVYAPQVVLDFWAADQAALTPAARQALRESAAPAPTVTRDMARAGVGILAGCDGGIPGFCVHAELQLMVGGGMTPQEALRTATINPARHLGMEATMGTVAAGKAADLVLLDANPLTDIANIRRIRAVILNGRFLSREALDDLLAQVRTEAAKP